LQGSGDAANGCAPLSRRRGAPLARPDGQFRSDDGAFRRFPAARARPRGGRPDGGLRSASYERLLNRAASPLQRPAPRQAMKRKRKQKTTASSPLFTMGKKFLSKASFQWNWVYATAISPQAMIAAHVVQRPATIRIPATVSMTPPNQASVPKGFG